MIPPTLEQTLEALERMTSLNGIFQHESNPNIENEKAGVWPYSIDDNARALIAEIDLPQELQNSIRTNIFFNYIVQANRLDNWFNNYKKQDSNFVQDDPKDLQDCSGRANWALAKVLFSNSSSQNQKEKAKELIHNSIENTLNLSFPMSQALSLIAFSRYLQKEDNKEIKKVVKSLSRKLLRSYKQESTKDWRFPAPEMTYCSARVPQAFLFAGEALKNQELISAGEEILEFTLEQMFKDKFFNPIGINWLKKGQKRSYDILKEGDKQPVEANVTAEVCYHAAKILENKAFLRRGDLALNWIKGANKEGLCLLAENGAVYDAIIPKKINSKWIEEINKNQGAEPIVTYLMAIGARRNLSLFYPKFISKF